MKLTDLDELRDVAAMSYVLHQMLLALRRSHLQINAAELSCMLSLHRSEISRMRLLHRKPASRMLIPVLPPPLKRDIRPGTTKWFLLEQAQ
jgi:hypothetical protein